MVMNRDGYIVRFNHMAEEFTGYRFDDVKDTPFFWEKFLLPDEARGVRQVFEGVRAGHVVPRHENYWVRWAGEKRLFRWYNTLLADAGGTMQ
jgi:PAS domain S-box-containing protein